MSHLFLQLQKYKKRIDEAIQECSKKKKETVEEAIKNLPPNQQEAVKACLQASTREGPSGRRYTIEWIYECILMKIKSSSLYQHIRDHEILPLPCMSTIRGYLKHFSGAYGFNPGTFEMLSKKQGDLEPAKKRGIT